MRGVTCEKSTDAAMSTADALPRGRPTLRGHIAIARIDHWFKNVFVLPGVAAALSVDPAMARPELLQRFAIGLASVCIVASSNYVVNEVLDAKHDLSHPVKSKRPVPAGLVNVPLAYVQWLVLMLVGVGLGFTLGKPFGFTMLVLWIMGCIYNI